MRSHYSKEDICTALESIGIKSGDTVFSHSNIGFFGIPAGEATQENAFQTILNAMLDVVGERGTLVVPTFTYSFSQGQNFDPDNTSSNCGMFAEMLRKHPDAHRSEDPSVSVAAIGAKAEELTKDVPVNAYGPCSFFDRFFEVDGVVCNLNFDAGSTFIHYVERLLQVPYRFDKTFTGKLISGGVEELRENTIWVRYLAEGTAAKFECFDALAREQGLFQAAQVGRGSVGKITAQQTLELIKTTLPDRPWFLTEAELLGIEPDLNNAKC